MNRDILEGDWKQLKGRLKQRWARLTDDDLREIEGAREELDGVLQRRYGLAREEVERQLEEFCEACKT